MGECEVWVRVRGVLGRLAEVREDHCLTGVRDDTLLHKLHTHLHTMLLKDTDTGRRCEQSTTLLQFVQAVMEPSVATNAKNSASVALALKIMGSLITVEKNFDNFADSKVLCHFLLMLPTVRGDPTLSSAALCLVQAIMKHQDGVLWLMKNGIWEKMLLPCLRSSSIFVQREGVNVITAFILELTDTQHFASLLKDLCILSDKLCELRRHLGNVEGEELRQSNLRVLNIFKQLYWQTLGKSAIYSKIRNVDDLNSRLLSILQCKVPYTSVTCITDVLILNLLHKFQEKLMSYGILEQFLLDSLCTDMISLTRLLVEHGYMESFIRSSTNIHKYWAVMVTHLKETKNIDLTAVEAILHIVTTFQVTSIVVLYQACLEQVFEAHPEKMKVVARWNEEIHSRINIKEEIKVEVGKLEKQIMAMLAKDPREAVNMALICVTTITSATDHLNPACAVTVFQGLIFLLCSQDCACSPIRHHTPLQRAVIDGLRILVERFNIDWRKCYASVCLMGKLCDVIKIPGISSQVKVCSLKAMNSCINGFIPPVMSMLVNSEQLEHNSVEQMGQVLAIYLGDVDWEVRDSALEVLITCMKLAKEKYPHFVDWLLRYKLNSAVLTALRDVEGYVRASAFTVLANIISIDKVWAKLEEENLPHRALASILYEGETQVRKAAITLTQELFLAGKFSDEEVSGLVVRVIQHSAEDPDDEVRLASLEFIRAHILWSLNKSGMVDGEFPSITFSKGKITKLDKEEVKSRVCSVLTWICECGYLCSLLNCLKDLVTAVVTKAREILCFINTLITRYNIHLEGCADKRKGRGGAGHSMKAREKTKAEDPTPRVMTVVGHEVTISGNLSQRDEIDKTISEILSSSSLETVATIKRPLGESLDNSSFPPKHLLLTLDDVPPASPSVPLSSLLQTVDSLCQNTNANESERQQTSDMISLLEDILLEGGQKQSHLDDQCLQDCY